MLNVAPRTIITSRPVADRPRFVYHPSFEEPGAEGAYGRPPVDDGSAPGYMVDDATRDCARRMHYAGWRAAGARTRRDAARWRQRYLDCRDRVVLGNRKLTFRAVQKWHPDPGLTDDLIAECQIVL